MGKGKAFLDNVGMQSSQPHVTQTFVRKRTTHGSPVFYFFQFFARSVWITCCLRARAQGSVFVPPSRARHQAGTLIFTGQSPRWRTEDGSFGKFINANINSVALRQMPKQIRTKEAEICITEKLLRVYLPFHSVPSAECRCWQRNAESDYTEQKRQKLSRRQKLPRMTGTFRMAPPKSRKMFQTRWQRMSLVDSSL